MCQSDFMNILNHISKVKIVHLIFNVQIFNKILSLDFSIESYHQFHTKNIPYNILNELFFANLCLTETS